MLSEPTDFCRLYLFRHPELDAAHQGCAVGAADAELSRRGRAQVLEWVQWLDGVRLQGVHSGPQAQCQEPARALATSHRLEAVVDPRLVDQQMGSWQGQPWSTLLEQDGDRVRAFFAEFGEARAPGGESLGEAVERVLAWWTATMPALRGESLAVVLPGSVLSGLAAALLGMRLSRCVSLNLPHGALGVLDAFQNGVRIACWNAGALE